MTVCINSFSFTVSRVLFILSLPDLFGQIPATTFSHCLHIGSVFMMKRSIVHQRVIIAVAMQNTWDFGRKVMYWTLQVVGQCIC